MATITRETLLRFESELFKAEIGPVIQNGECRYHIISLRSKESSSVASLHFASDEIAELITLLDMVRAEVKNGNRVALPFQQQA